MSNNIYVNYCSVDTPYTFEEAMSNNDSVSWVKVMGKEIESFNENKACELVMKIPNEKVLDVKWVYSEKSEDFSRQMLLTTYTLQLLKCKLYNFGFPFVASLT